MRKVSDFTETSGVPYWMPGASKLRQGEEKRGEKERRNREGDLPKAAGHNLGGTSLRPVDVKPQPLLDPRVDR